MLPILMLLAEPGGAQPILVEGRAYRVDVAGGTVTVTGPAPGDRHGRRWHRQMHEAVERATHCRMVRDGWQNAALVGTLDCSGSTEPDAP